MIKSNILFKEWALESLQEGVSVLNNAVGSTYGPNGRNVIISQDGSVPTSTKDGVTVAKAITLEDQMHNMGAQLVKQASIKTADEAGDGTTTSTILASSLFLTGAPLLSKQNRVEVKRGIELAATEAKNIIKEHSVEITEEDQIKQVATISANNDNDVGELIAASMDNVGRDGIITIEESRTGETYLETVEGMQFDRGYKSPYFVTDNSSMTAILDKPQILITDKRITAAKELLPILEACSSQNQSLLIIADEIDGEALSTLVVNKMRGIVSTVAVKAPQYGDRKKDMLEDIATLTGGTVISTEKGMRLDKFNPDWLGKARKVTVGKDTTTIVDGKGSEESITQRVNDLKELIDNSKSPYEMETLQDRLGRMVGGVGIIHVGGLTEVEMKEKKDRVEDALHATKAALEEGILPGGGVTLLRIAHILNSNIPEFSHPDQKLGYSIAIDSFQDPIKKLLINALGEVESERVHEIINDILDNNDFWYGYNPRTETFENFLESGIIDPTKVTRLALENAVSVAGTMLTTDCMVQNTTEDSNKDELMNTLM